MSISTNTNTNTNAAELDAQLVSASEDGESGVVQLLLEAGADANAWGNMPLGSASFNGHAEVVKLLLFAGADVHAMDVDDLVLMDAVVKILTPLECVTRHMLRLG